LREQTQLRTSEHHDVGAAAAQPLGALGAVAEQGQQLVLCESVGERTEPDLETGVRRVHRGDLQAIGIASGDADGSAVKVVADDLHLAPHDVRVEWFVGAGADAEEAGVVVDAFDSHGAAPVIARTGAVSQIRYCTYRI
jgi:hypothetical protein